MPELNCATCTADQKLYRGCETDAPIPTTVMGVDHWRCLRRPVLDDPRGFSYWLRLFHNFRQGFLPEPGAYMEQSALVLDVFYFLDSVYGKIEEFRREQAKAKSGTPPAEERSRVSSRG